MPFVLAVYGKIESDILNYFAPKNSQTRVVFEQLFFSVFQETKRRL